MTFKKSKKSSLVDTLSDVLLKPKPKPSHKKRNLFALGLAATGVTLIASGLKKDEPR